MKRGEGGCSVEIRRPMSRGWKNFRCRWTREVGDLENCTIFMDVIYVSSHTYWRQRPVDITLAMSVSIKYLKLNRCSQNLNFEIEF